MIKDQKNILIIIICIINAIALSQEIGIMEEIYSNTMTNKYELEIFYVSESKFYRLPFTEKSIKEKYQKCVKGTTFSFKKDLLKLKSIKLKKVASKKPDRFLFLMAIFKPVDSRNPTYKILIGDLITINGKTYEQNDELFELLKKLVNEKNDKIWTKIKNFWK